MPVQDCRPEQVGVIFSSLSRALNPGGCLFSFFFLILTAVKRNFIISKTDFTQTDSFYKT